MKSLRLAAIQAATSRQIRKIDRPRDSLGNPLPVSEYFGVLTFGLDQMKEKLSKESFEALTAMVQKGDQIEKSVADEIAGVVKDWAIARGATHFCHWFQPMTGLTAEKHDAFIQTNTSDFGQTKVIEKLSGSAFLQSEPDASSFPSGGMRNTFEARGYTAWDPTSPIFIMAHTNGRTLCMPSAYISYHGHALDNKTPLLRSIGVLSEKAAGFLKLLGDVDVKNVSTTLGVEQEYFLVDRAFFSHRPDLVMTGRTLQGAASSRGQQFEDHYFGSIPSRILAFMHELEQEMYRVGVPLKTRHNEVAPGQFEVAPVFEEANVASDHNCLLMDMLRRVAFRHDLVCLIHEKPFAGINGNGKHNNWSLSTDRGDNLLDPGKTPHQNLRFLAVLATVIKAVHDHSGVLRAGIASPGNDHRLGANEAPPAILSIFLGETLTKICKKIEAGEVMEDKPAESVINLGVASLPRVSKDNTDRNRTSPFAFTGNKFEFRAVGGSANVSVPVTFLNAAVADSFAEMTKRLKEKLDSGTPRDEAVLTLIREVLKETNKVCFEGNNYSEDWVAEAKKRGLPNLLNTPVALSPLRDQKQTSFLNELNILTKDELSARYNVMLERYVKQIELEAVTLLELVDTNIFPAIEADLLAKSSLVEQLDEAKSKIAGELVVKKLKEIEALYSELGEARTALEKSFHQAEKLKDEIKKADLLADQVMPAMESLRSVCDRIELKTSDDNWTLPKYREILFLR